MEESISETDGNTTLEPGRKPSGKDKKETDGNTAVEAGRKPPGENKKETDEKNKQEVEAVQIMLISVWGSPDAGKSLF